MDYGLRDKRVLITGGTRGIGRATTLAFARAGSAVVACHSSDGNEVDTLRAELDEIGNPYRVVQADVTRSTEATRLASAVRETFGGIEVLVNNVGVDGAVLFDGLTQDEWRRVMDHNVDAAYYVTHSVLDQLSDYSSIVNIGSSVGLRGRPGGVHYSTSKAALVGFTRALCKELGSRGIRVNTVAPGLTETEPGAGLPSEVVEHIVGMTALGRICQPDDVAGAVLFLAGDTSRYISGMTLNVDGGV